MSNQRDGDKVGPAPVFKCEQHDDTLVIVPLGHSLQFSAGQVEAQMNKVLESFGELGIKNVVVDLRSVSLLDSIVIGSIVAFAKTALKSGGQAILCNVSGRVQETLNTVRLDKLMPQCATREEALAALQQ